jgi:hypothetical protein
MMVQEASNKKELQFLILQLFFLLSSGWQDSNLRPPAPKAGALTGLRYTPQSFIMSTLRPSRSKSGRAVYPDLNRDVKLIPKTGINYVDPMWGIDCVDPIPNSKGIDLRRSPSGGGISIKKHVRLPPY